MNETTLADLMGTQNCSKIARELKKSRGAVSRWAKGETTPSAADLPKLADILRVDLATLTRIIARDAAERAAA